MQESGVVQQRVYTGTLELEMVCLGNIPLNKLGKAKLTPTRTIECEPKSFYVINPQKYGYQVSVHASCTHNEMAALHNRHLIDRSYIPFDNQYWNKNVDYAKTWNFDIEPTTYHNIVMSYKGGKRKIYWRAMMDLRTNGLRDTDHYIKMFIKYDKLAVGDIQNKMPRAIQYRTARYNLSIAVFLKPYEHVFYSMPGNGPSGTRIVTKGLSNVDIADLLIFKASHFDKPIYLGLDHSKFDSTVRKEHLVTEHNCYNRVFKSNWLRFLLRRQLHNKGFSRTGIKYKVEGTRMSGDYNTGLGNSILNRLVLESFVRGLKHEILLDGDDSIVIIEYDDLNKLDLSHFGRMGFETKCEVYDDIQHIDYCQKRLVFSNPPTMVRNPVRMLSNMAVCLKRYLPKSYIGWVKSVYDCERLGNPGIPICRSFPDLKVKAVKDEDYDRKMESASVRVDCSLQAVCDSWGLDVVTLADMDSSVQRYLGYNSHNGKNRLLSQSIQPLDSLSNAGGTTKHEASIIERFYSLYASNSECWSAIGTPVMGYAADVKCPTQRPTRDQPPDIHSKTTTKKRPQINKRGTPSERRRNRRHVKGS